MSVTVCCAVIVAGAVYTPEALTLPVPDGLIDQVTAEFEVLVSVAVNCAVCEEMSVMFAGLTLTEIGGLSVTVAEALLVLSAVLVAVTVTVCCVLTVLGAEYKPAVLMLPTPVGLIDHVTAVLPVPETAAVNCCVWPG